MASPWRIDHETACVTTSAWSGQVSLTHPQWGLRHVQWGKHKAPHSHLLELVWPGMASAIAPEDAYARGRDLVLTYAETASHPFRVQVYWRVLDDTTASQSCGANGVELIVSAQTHLLDCDPTLEVRSRWPSHNVLSAARLAMVPLGDSPDMPRESDAAAGVWLTRLAHAPLSLVCLSYPGDCETGCLTYTLAEETLSLRLFRPQLEKGVIRRARVRCLFVDRNGDEDMARHLLNDFWHSPLPLTT